jgi:hypothetical protein
VLGVDRAQARLFQGILLDVDRLGLGQHDLAPRAVHLHRLQAGNVHVEPGADVELRDLGLPGKLDLAVAQEVGLAGEAPRHAAFGEVGGRGVDGLFA